MEELNSTMQQPTAYNDDDIKTLDWNISAGALVCILVNWEMVAMRMMGSMYC